MATINMSIRVDPELKAQAEYVLNQLGMTMNGTINMFLQQIVREKSVPLNLSFVIPPTTSGKSPLKASSVSAWHMRSARA